MPDSGGGAPAKKKAKKQITNPADLVKFLNSLSTVKKVAAQQPANPDPHNWQAIAASLAQQNSGGGNSGGGGGSPQISIPSGGGVPGEAAPMDPAIMAIIQQLLQGQAGTAASVAEGQQAVQGFYDQNTGDILQSGQNWLAQLMPQIANLGVNPMAMANDPAFANYAQTLSGLDETSDLNLAGDLSWFEKMGQIYNQDSANLMAGIQSGLIPLPGAEVTGGGGGGGGGGGRGYGRGRGGGGGNGSGYGDPKTTDLLAETAETNFGINNPGFYETMMAQFEGDPVSQQIVDELFAKYGTSNKPQNVLGGLAKNEIPNTRALIAQLTAQDQQQQAYQASIPVREPAGGDIYEGINAVMIGAAQEAAKRANSGAVAGKNFGTGEDWNADEMGQISGSLEARRRQLIEQQDKEAYEKARASNPNFTFENWPGYVPEVDQEDLTKQQEYMTIVEQLYALASEFDPNRSWQETHSRMKDQSRTATTGTSYSPDDAIFEPGAEASTALDPSTNPPLGPGNPGPYGMLRGLPGGMKKKFDYSGIGNPIKEPVGIIAQAAAGPMSPAAKVNVKAAGNKAKLIANKQQKAAPPVNIPPTVVGFNAPVKKVAAAKKLPKTKAQLAAEKKKKPAKKY
jgi:hypothetical protein